MSCQSSAFECVVGKLLIIIPTACVYWRLGCARPRWGQEERTGFVFSSLTGGQPWKAGTLIIPVTRFRNWGTEKLGKFPKVTQVIHLAQGSVTMGLKTSNYRSVYINILITFILASLVAWFMGSQRVRHDWATELNWTSGSVLNNPPADTGDEFDPWVRKILWSRKWQPTLVFLPGKSCGQRNLVGYSP